MYVHHIRWVLTEKWKTTQMRAPNMDATLYLKAAKMETSVALPSRRRVGTHVISWRREVKGAATEASADEREMPV